MSAIGQDIISYFLFRCMRQEKALEWLTYIGYNRWTWCKKHWQTFWYRYTPAWIQQCLTYGKRNRYLSRKQLKRMCWFTYGAKYMKMKSSLSGGIPKLKREGACRFVGPLKQSYHYKPLFLVHIHMHNTLSQRCRILSRLFTIYFDSYKKRWTIRLLLPDDIKANNTRFKWAGRVRCNQLQLFSQNDIQNYLQRKLVFGKAYDTIRSFVQGLRGGYETFRFDWCRVAKKEHCLPKQYEAYYPNKQFVMVMGGA